MGSSGCKMKSAAELNAHNIQLVTVRSAKEMTLGAKRKAMESSVSLWLDATTTGLVQERLTVYGVCIIEDGLSSEWGQSLLHQAQIYMEQCKFLLKENWSLTVATMGCGKHNGFTSFVQSHQGRFQVAADVAGIDKLSLSVEKSYGVSIGTLKNNGTSFREWVNHEAPWIPLVKALGCDVITNDISFMIGYPNAQPQRWHQDSGAFPSLTIIVPLDPCGMHKDNGPTTMKLKSHRRESNNWTDLEDCMQKSPAEFVEVHAAPGSVVVFDQRLWHRGSTNLGDVNRHVLILSYYTKEDSRRTDVDFGTKILTNRQSTEEKAPCDVVESCVE